VKKGVALLLVFVFLSASCLIMPLSVGAGSKTLVVPDDYPTIASAIGNATQGTTILVKKGTYQEHTLVISKTLTLIGEEKETTVIKKHRPAHNRG